MRSLLLISKANFHKLVIIRHGESTSNKEKKWAGWEDVPLSAKGVNQAIECAKLLKNAKL